MYEIYKGVQTEEENENKRMRCTITRLKNREIRRNVNIKYAKSNVLKFRVFFV